MNIITHTTRNIENILDTPHGTAHFDNAQYQAFKRAHADLVSPTMLKAYALSPLAGYTAEQTPQETTEAMRFGSLVHAYTLTPWVIGKTFVAEERKVELKKDGTPYADGRQSAAQKTEWAELEAQGVQVNTTEEHTTAATMSAHAAAAIDEYFSRFSILPEWETELTLWARNPNSGITLCGTADAINRELHAIADVKTIADAELDDRTLINTFFKYGYNLQAGGYSKLYFENSGAKLQYFLFVFVSKSAPHHAKILVLDRPQLDRCEADLFAALDNYEQAHPMGGQLDFNPETQLSPVLAPCTRSPYYIPAAV